MIVRTIDKHIVMEFESPEEVSTMFGLFDARPIKNKMEQELGYDVSEEVLDHMLALALDRHIPTLHQWNFIERGERVIIR